MCIRDRPYAQCVVYPKRKLPLVDGRRRFNLCATKNAGLKRALANGADVIICTDVDMCYELGCWNHLVSVDDATASVPIYRMIQSAMQRKDGHLDHGATGTVAMTAANWRQCRWDERCVGYGADDGILLGDIRRAGLRIDRDAIVCHVEHPGAVSEVNEPGHGRAGCYGRDAFNFDNFKENRKLHGASKP